MNVCGVKNRFDVAIRIVQNNRRAGRLAFGQSDHRINITEFEYPSLDTIKRLVRIPGSAAVLGPLNFDQVEWFSPEFLCDFSRRGRG